ncbi:hypothetical protein B0H14DRAFT_2617016 [Mycena olivaceomarginata]|nr:hypothetical protein B0H14DRAFT_2617016 [Mycena olivaceomarginata]
MILFEFLIAHLLGDWLVPTRLFCLLAKFGQLRTLAIPAADGIPWAYSVFKLCPLQVIHIKRPVQEWEQSDLPKNDPVLMALLKFPQLTALSKSVPPESILEVPLIAPSLNPLFIPMASTPNEVRDKV